MPEIRNGGQSLCALDFNPNTFREALERQAELKNSLPKNAMGGVKDDAEKLLWSLLPWDSLEDIVKILMLGAKKYSRDNWKKVDRERYVDAALRHLTAFLNGEVCDKESGLPHLHHLGCCVLFLISLYGSDSYEYSAQNQPETD